MLAGIMILIGLVLFMTFILIATVLESRSRERISKVQEETKRQAIESFRDKLKLEISTADIAKLLGDK
jgi:hypothetical protein